MAMEGLSDKTLANMRPMPLAKRARLRAGMTQDVFSTTYGIPLRTLQEWEQLRAGPDATATAYLRAIANDPAAVARAYDPRAA